MLLLYRSVRMAPMRKAMPIVHETVVDLKQHLRRVRDGRKKLRLQMLYRLASEQAHTRYELAQLLSLSRNTVGRWLADYERGGLPVLLPLYGLLANSPPLLPRCLPVLKRPSTSPTTLNPIMTSKPGSNIPLVSRSSTKRSLPSCGSALRPS